jgi:hypothetical protein
MRPSLVRLLLAVITTACADGAAVAPSSPLTTGALSIQLDKTSYTPSEASANGGEGIRGTIRNNDSRSYYTRLGDAFAAGEEQEQLYIAGFSDGALERETASASWAAVQAPLLVEGVRFVILKPGRTYRFIANATGDVQPGNYRITVSYRSTIADEEPAVTGKDVSAVFQIR